MKTVMLVVLVFILFCIPLIAQSPHKVWVSREYEDRGDRVLFIQDIETGTRCYAITSERSATSGYAIACVSKRNQ